METTFLFEFDAWPFISNFKAMSKCENKNKQIQFD